MDVCSAKCPSTVYTDAKCLLNQATCPVQPPYYYTAIAYCCCRPYHPPSFWEQLGTFFAEMFTCKDLAACLITWGSLGAFAIVVAASILTGA